MIKFLKTIEIMKRNYLILLTILFSTYSIAQVEFEQGTFLMEMGSTGFSSQNITSWEGLGGYMESNGDIRDAEFNDLYDSFSQNELALNVGAGYFIADGLVLGLGVEYKSTSQNIKYSSEAIDNGYENYDETESELIINPGIRYYFGESGFWTMFSYGIATINMDDSDDSFDDAEFPKRSAMHLAAGYAISLNDYVSLNPTIGYNLTTQTTKDGGSNMNGEEVDQVIKSGTFGVGISLTVHLSSY